MKPTFIGLGGQKCASSWLYLVFNDHPDAFVSKPKELNFFSSSFDRGFQWYESHFDSADGRSAVGEISPSYLPDWNAPARAHRYNPAFRILVTLRDPVERAYSNHLHDIRLAYYRGSDLSFEAGLLNNPMYLEQSRYAHHLGRWLDFFPADQMLILLQEEIQADPNFQAQRVYKFLEIDQAHVSDFVDRRANQSYLPKSRSRETFFRSAGALTRKLGFRWVDRLMRRTGAISALHRTNRLEIRSIVPPMHDETAAMLYATFADDTLRLAELMGRKALPWKTWERAVAKAGIPSTKAAADAGAL
jgi:hypothetical protein